ncbi:MAG: CoA ester lyase [Chloroflexi bacterium]|nr:CoA ester lyase [Chloroflexota bacterium]
MTVLRSLLFVPGNQPNMLEKATGFRPDAFVPDMEDSVPMEEKANARKTVADHLPALAERGPLVIPRVNSLDTGLLEEDLEAVVGPHIYGVSVGKIYTIEDVHAISSILDGLEEKAGLPNGQTRLLPWIETAMAIVRCYEICSSSPRIAGVSLGAEDFTNDMGIERTKDDSEIAFPRSVIGVSARAADVLALDTPFFSFRDPEGLRENCLGSRKVGFKGKFAIHPAQIDVINEAFSPSPSEIEHAKRVIEAFEEAQSRGRGSTSLDGHVVDVPVVKRAEALLELAASLPGATGPGA